tara:strand:+ start:1502 stop:2416 length:915 start_codon:yes stop_codon:yes gene_type:complete
MKNKLVIVTHVMPWELDQFVELSAQLKRNSYYLQQMKVTLDVTLNLSDDIVDWKNSKLPMEYFQEKFDGIIKLYDWCEINHKTISSGNYGCVTARVDSTYNYEDCLMMWIDPDVILSDLSLMIYENVINSVNSDMFVVCPQTSKWGDPSWDPITHDRHINKPYEFHKDFDVYEINKFTNEDYQNISVYENNPTKFAGGLCATFPNKLLRRLFDHLPKDVPGYGIEDYYIMVGIDNLKRLGKDVKQYVIKNLLIAENIKYNNLIEYTKNYLTLKVTRQQQRDETTRITKDVFTNAMNSLIQKEQL